MKRNSILLIVIMVTTVFGMVSMIAPTNAQSSTLTVAVSDQQQAIINQYKARFEAAANGIDEVKVVSTGSQADDQRSLLVTAMSQGSSEYDVIHMDVIWTAEFASNDWLLELDYDQAFLDKYLDAHVEAMTYENKVFASPFFFDSGLVLYRADILQRNGFTIDDFQTWSDFKTNLNAIIDNQTEIELNPNLEGYVAQSDAYEGGVVNLVEWMGASGGTFLEDGEANFESAEPALKWWKSLIAPRYTTAAGNADTDAVMERSELVGDEGSAFTKWIAGNAVFQRNWPFSYAASADDAFLNGTTASADWPADTPRFGVTVLPYNSTSCDASCSRAALGGAVLGIPTFSENQAAAKQFLEFVAGYDQQLEMFQEVGNLPAMIDVYTGTDIPADSYIKDFYNNVFQNVIPRPIHPDYAAMSEAIQPLFHDAISGARDIGDAITLMNEEVTIVLEEADNNTEAPGFTIGMVFFLGTLAIATRYLKRKKDI